MYLVMRHPHSLLSAFVFRSFESIISRLSVAKETGLSLALSKTPKTGLFCVEAFYYFGPCFYSYPLQRFLFDVLRNSKLVST